jgi:hypothetical protein
MEEREERKKLSFDDRDSYLLVGGRNDDGVEEPKATVCGCN